MSLVEWHKRGFVRKHSPGKQEIAALLAVADRELADASGKLMMAAYSTALGR